VRGEWGVCVRGGSVCRVQQVVCTCCRRWARSTFSGCLPMQDPLPGATKNCVPLCFLAAEPSHGTSGCCQVRACAAQPALQPFPQHNGPWTFSADGSGQGQSPAKHACLAPAVRNRCQEGHAHLPAPNPASQTHTPTPTPTTPTPAPTPTDKIILVRHAESEGNVNSATYTFTPDSQVCLTERGRQQVGPGGR